MRYFNLVGVFVGIVGYRVEVEEWGIWRGGGFFCVGEEVGDIY